MIAGSLSSIPKMTRQAPIRSRRYPLPVSAITCAASEVGSPGVLSG